MCVTEFTQLILSKTLIHLGANRQYCALTVHPALTLKQLSKIFKYIFWSELS